MSGQINFWSGKNYMKRSSASGFTPMAAPATSAYGGALYITSLSVPHNLGYIPLFNVNYEPFNDGVIWPALGSRLGGEAFDPLDGVTTGPYLLAWPDTVNLNLEIGYVSNALTGTFNVYYVIYLDYGL